MSSPTSLKPKKSVPSQSDHDEEAPGRDIIAFDSSDDDEENEPSSNFVGNSIFINNVFIKFINRFL